MTRKTLGTLLIASVAMLSLGSLTEAAGPKKIVRHHAKHSTRVPAARPAHAKKKLPAGKHKKKIGAARKTGAKAKPKPTTKPR